MNGRITIIKYAFVIWLHEFHSSKSFKNQFVLHNIIQFPMCLWETHS